MTFRAAAPVARRLICWSAVMFAVGTITPPAQAAFHLWQISEVYSNASGTVQFVELFTDQSSQQFVSFSGGLTSTSHSAPTSPDLPGDSTNKHFLLATPGFAALPGGVTPDYTLPANFLSTTADTISYVGATFPSLTFSAGQLPTDGNNSLNRAYLGALTPPPTSFTSAGNSPTNFAGQTGHLIVPEPVGLGLLAFGGACLLRPRARHAVG